MRLQRHTVYVLALLLIASAILLRAATAHVNDRGMDYRPFKDRFGQSCCDVDDCRPAADFVETIVDGQPVVRLLIEGIWFTVSRSYVIAAPASDGRAHFCGRLHRPSGNPADVKAEPICVILPPHDT
jgi:hypothetical protein